MFFLQNLISDAFWLNILETYTYILENFIFPPYIYGQENLQTIQAQQ